MSPIPRSGSKRNRNHDSTIGANHGPPDVEKHCNAQHAGLAELKELKNLRSLILDGTHVTPAGEKELKAALPELQVTISRPRVASN